MGAMDAKGRRRGVGAVECTAWWQQHIAHATGLASTPAFSALHGCAIREVVTRE